MPKVPTQHEFLYVDMPQNYFLKTTNTQQHCLVYNHSYSAFWVAWGWMRAYGYTDYAGTRKDLKWVLFLKDKDSFTRADISMTILQTKYFSIWGC